MTVSRRHREAAIANSNDETTVIPQVPTEPPALPQTMRQVGEAITQVFAPVLAGLRTEPPRPRWRRVLDRFGDAGWHRTARQCAGTALMWGFTTTAFVIFGKAMLWVLFL